MAYEPRLGDGALFRNDRRETDKHPNATGYVIAHRDIKEGEKLNLAAWTKDGGKGKFQSIRMSDVRVSGNEQPNVSGNASDDAGEDDSDSIPF